MCVCARQCAFSSVFSAVCSQQCVVCHRHAAICVVHHHHVPVVLYNVRLAVLIVGFRNHDCVKLVTLDQPCKRVHVAINGLLSDLQIQVCRRQNVIAGLDRWTDKLIKTHAHSHAHTLTHTAHTHTHSFRLYRSQEVCQCRFVKMMKAFHHQPIK